MTKNRCVGRPCIFIHAMTAAERKRRQREKLHPRIKMPKWKRKHKKIKAALKKIRNGRPLTNADKRQLINIDNIQEGIDNDCLKEVLLPKELKLYPKQYGFDLRKRFNVPRRQWTRKGHSEMKVLGSVTRIRCYVMLSKLLTSARLRTNIRFKCELRQAMECWLKLSKYF